MGKEYSAPSENLATETVALIPPETLGACDEFCDMSLVELRDFWWAYSYDLIRRLPSVKDAQQSPRMLTASADTLLAANDSTSTEFFMHRTEPRLGTIQVVRFAFKHLLPALAEKFSPDLKTEVQALILEKYGAKDK